MSSFPLKPPLAQRYTVQCTETGICILCVPHLPFNCTSIYLGQANMCAVYLDENHVAWWILLKSKMSENDMPFLFCSIYRERPSWSLLTKDKTMGDKMEMQLYPQQRKVCAIEVYRKVDNPQVNTNENKTKLFNTNPKLLMTNSKPRQK